MQTIRLIVKGKVQGVFYRASAREAADLLNLKGWVRNMPDGAVEIMVTGEEEGIEDFIKWCFRGPSKARVESVEKELTGFRYFEDFRIIR